MGYIGNVTKRGEMICDEPGAIREAELPLQQEQQDEPALITGLAELAQEVPA